jgi:hypothetical protein
MNRLQELAGINEIEAPIAPTTADAKVQGSINIKLFQQLDPSLTPASISTTVGKVKNGSALNMNDNKVLAGLMTSMIKTSDDGLLAKIFANLKQIQTK